MLSTHDIKQAILYPDPNVRILAVHYFSRSFSDDATVMPLVIEAVEKYGRSSSVHIVGEGENLPQTEATIQWCIDELSREHGEDETELDDYWFALSKVLVHADPSLTLNKESEICELPHFSPPLGSALSERIHLLAEDSASLWTKLEDFCERERHKRYLSEMDLPQANRLVEALGRDDGLAGRVLELLNEEIDEPADSPRALMQGFVIRLAGELRMRTAIPALIQLLKEDDEWFNEECQRALIRIGGDDVVEALSNEFPTAEWHFRLYGTGVLEHVHTDSTFQKCLTLFEAENDDTIKIGLGQATLSQFAIEGIEPVRQYIRLSKVDAEILELRDTLVSVSNVLGVEFPELQKWEQSEEDHRALRRKMYAEKYGSFQDSAIDGDDEFEDDLDGPELDAFREPTTVVRHDTKIGRNDPCPCGSGKKYKKCCLNKTNGNPLLN